MLLRWAHCFNIKSLCFYFILTLQWLSFCGFLCCLWLWFDLCLLLLRFWITYFSDIWCLNLMSLWGLYWLMSVQTVLLYCYFSAWYLSCTTNVSIYSLILHETAFKHFLCRWLWIILRPGRSIPNMRIIHSVLTLIDFILILLPCHGCYSTPTILNHLLCY
jgi:hypothetical protein